MTSNIHEQDEPYVAYALQRLQAGEKPAEVKQGVLREDLEEPTALAVYAEARRRQQRARRRAGLRDMGSGVLVLAIAAAVTGGTYALAEPGGTYMVASGAIGLGFLMLLFGMWGFLRSFAR